MSSTTATLEGNHLPGINADRLFKGSCLALIATAVNFAVMGAIMGPLKEQFILTNEQVGWIGGAGLWGFTLSILIFGPLCDALGMRFLLWLAFVCHFAGVLIMIFATGFTMLLVGQLTIAMGNGLVEAACNPLIATIYPTRKTAKLNQFHVWFPGGIVIGGLAAYLLDKLGIPSWQLKLCVILVPTVIYGRLFIGQKFPKTERLQSGISFSGMVHATLMRPLFLVLLVCMGITASLELGPNRWIPSVLESGGIPGILVLVWISGLMALLRFYAGPVVHRLAPTGILLLSGILSGAGLIWLSYAESTAMAFVSATLFAVGVCYFWPTMLGIASERVPKGGALALALLGGFGNVIVGMVASPQMGTIADRYGHDRLPVVETRAVLQRVTTVYAAAASGEAQTRLAVDVERAREEAQKVLQQATGDSLPMIETANALRTAINCAPNTEEGRAVAAEAKKILGPADNYGGRMSFRYVAPFSIVLILVFGTLWLSDRRKGGYKVETIGDR
ncbi:MAG TPA: MFS transporter [Candidatus Hydrogenedentes bacterium]|nr:MFS transporter [Candidatus Hydrogenedentota bacterium]HOS02327.1 MFS transporter [Candidatus Hydrogenedentota bacterium]